MHPTSLPSRYGSGDIGPGARAFLDTLARAGQSVWQMLPIGPVGYGDSPYSAQSAFAGNPYLISIDDLVTRGLLPKAALAPPLVSDPRRLDYETSNAFRERALEVAHYHFVRGGGLRDPAYLRFCRQHASWLDDFALFCAIKGQQGGVAWTRWPAPLRDRDRDAIEQARSELSPRITYYKFSQYIFDEQWRALHDRAKAMKISLIGDVPIFVAHDSADVWRRRASFRLDDGGNPTVVAGVPPDYFSRTGQRWGNPVYRWKHMKKSGYAFWRQRVGLLLQRFDVLRLDHFIGFVHAWEIPASEPTAIHGRYVPGPGRDLFRALARDNPALPLIAEDLGAVTDEVVRLRDRLGLPGLRILQFAFGTDPSGPSFKPHNYVPNTVAYTGTHDNDTVVGWFDDEGGPQAARSEAQASLERDSTLRYLGTEGREIHWEMIRALMVSVANLVVFPLQDVLGLGSDARMNRPGDAVGNWRWRFTDADLTPSIVERLAELTMTYDRAPPPRSHRVEPS